MIWQLRMVAAYPSQHFIDHVYLHHQPCHITIPHWQFPNSSFPCPPRYEEGLTSCIHGLVITLLVPNEDDGVRESCNSPTISAVILVWGGVICAASASPPLSHDAKPIGYRLWCKCQLRLHNSFVKCDQQQRARLRSWHTTCQRLWPWTPMEGFWAFSVDGCSIVICLTWAAFVSLNYT